MTEQKYIEETVVNCLICVLIFLVLHDIMASICIFCVQTLLTQGHLLQNKEVSTFLQNNVMPLASCIGNLVGIPFLLYWIKKYHKKETTSIKYKTMFFIFVAIGASLFINGVLILSGLTKIFANDYEQTTNQIYGGALVVTILFSGIIAPITEELLYRKILYSQIRESYGFWIATIASSLLFGIAHMAIVQGIYGFFTGMLLCYCYEVGNKIKTSVLVHIMMNLVSIIGTQFLYTMLPEQQTIFWIVGSIVGMSILSFFVVKTHSNFTCLTKRKVK